MVPASDEAPMQSQELKEVIVQAAGLLEYFKREAEASGQTSREAAERLAQAAELGPRLLRQAADEAFAQVSGNATRAVRDGVQAPLETFERRMLDNDKRIAAATNEFSKAAGRLDALQRRLLLAAGFSALAIALAIAATTVVLWQMKQEIRRNQISVELLRAYNKADVTLCEGRLCARIDPKAKPYGDYLPVAPR
ncbi:hypothetical protein [Lysobacter sp. CA199]|uniref:hypothetical protein n=1 Tax=Lysobacter sp. CA199 TaxID=3455608 RepID=UPI003F8D3091